MKLTYTEEMKQQDELWKIENEDFDVMEKLFYNIMEEAKQKGFNGCYKIYQASNECVCEVYANEEEAEKCRNGEIDTEFMFGYCEPLIEHLEKYYLKNLN